MEISVCSIMWNEEAMLPIWVAHLRSLRQVKQIILVDTGSIDDSVRVAKDLGVDVVETREFRGFADCRNRAMELAKCDWLALQWYVDELFSRGFEGYIDELPSHSNKIFLIPRFIDVFDCRYLLDKSNCGQSSRYLVHKSVGPKYEGHFPEVMCANGYRMTVGADPIRPWNITTQPGMIHARYLKMWLSALLHGTSFATQEGISRKRYYESRPAVDAGVLVDAPYYKAAMENYQKRGDEDMLNFVGWDEFNWILGFSALVEQPIESYIDNPDVLRILSSMPRRSWIWDQVRDKSNFVRKASEIYTGGS
jgi:glycosyltransferase involved in cell wall biosynthesis